MPDSPKDLLRDLDATQPALRELPSGEPPGAEPPVREPAPREDGLLRRLRDWLARRLDRDELTRFIRHRFVPWIEDQTKRSTRAGRAFWEELGDDERQRLRAFLTDVSHNPRDAVRSRSREELALLVIAVRRGLLAAREVWSDPE
jgi:hypothetical protein